ncbi:rod shape-determining protein MreD [Sphingobacterium oryzagri]|uniref:Rod shape-determining protein MreD n=1 Tax=Sphingobacterium oryzagri TaxID=3025669 RepID=A0ABY7WKM1_9SPHI|nr:rod shape-determining protein MreD [Sphingobacterium sp. KACC 22765]WDF70146.1 rod shape-determining protein MreD [Sphingobacterium sp. KACC 22765]
MGKVIIFNAIRFFVVVLLQVALFKNIGYYNLASVFPYIFFIFLLPIGLPNVVLFVTAFLTGLTVDAFYDSVGVHAAACVALALFRTFFHKITLEVEIKDSFNTPSLGEMGTKWFLPYVFFGTLIHHLTLFLVETFSFTNFLYTLASIILSSIFTVSVIFLMSLLVYKRKSRINSI